MMCDDVQVLSLPSQSCVSKVKVTEMSTIATAEVIPVKGMIHHTGGSEPGGYFRGLRPPILKFSLQNPLSCNRK